MVFHWSLSDSKSRQVSEISSQYSGSFSIMLLVWMISTRPPTSKSPRPFNNSLITMPKAPITIGIIVTLMFHSFFNSLARLSSYSSFHILSVLFCDQPGPQNRQFCIFSFFVVDYYKVRSSGRD